MATMFKYEEKTFAGLNPYARSNKYLLMDRVSEDQNKIVVKVSPDQLLRTRYGYALILDSTHVVFIKEWQVTEEFELGRDVLLDRKYWNVKEWGHFEDYGECEENYSFDTWLTIASEQNAENESGDKINPVIWKRVWYGEGMPF